MSSENFKKQRMLQNVNMNFFQIKSILLNKIKILKSIVQRDFFKKMF